MGFLPPRARPWLAGAVVIGCGQAVLLVAQAAVLGRLLAAAFYGGLSGPAAARAALLIASLAPRQALARWAWEACTEAAPRRARAAVRRQALAAVLNPGHPGHLPNPVDPPGAAARVASTGPGGMTTL